MESMSTIAAGLTIAFVYGWKLTLVVLAFLPVIMVSGRVQGRVIAGSAKSGKSVLHEAGKVSSRSRPGSWSRSILVFGP